MPRQSNRGRSNRGASRNESRSDGVLDIARERPLATAAAVGGAVAAGVFLWNRRNQISDQISHLSDQISDWTENLTSGSGDEFGAEDDTAGLTTSTQTGSRSSRRSGARGLSETGGGNASLGAHSGGIGTTTTGSPSGRGRAQSATPVG